MQVNTPFLNSLLGLSTSEGCKRFAERYPRINYACQQPHTTITFPPRTVIFKIRDKKIYSYYVNHQ